MRGGNGIRSRFLLVIDHDADSSTKDVARKFCASLSDVVELRLARQHGITLVRPDGYIAYSAHNHDGIAAFAAVRSLLERQTRASAGVEQPGVHAQ
jgi:hypothetical protein